MKIEHKQDGSITTHYTPEEWEELQHYRNAFKSMLQIVSDPEDLRKAWEAVQPVLGDGGYGVTYIGK